MSDQSEFVAELRVTLPAVDIMIRVAEHGASRDVRVALIDASRRASDDMITERVAVNLAIGFAAAIGIEPSTGAHVTLTFTTSDGAGVDVDATPPIERALGRMVAAVTMLDLLGARDIFRAFATTHPDQVTEFLTCAVDSILAVPRARRTSKGAGRSREGKP